PLSRARPRRAVVQSALHLHRQEQPRTRPARAVLQGGTPALTRVPSGRAVPRAIAHASRPVTFDTGYGGPPAATLIASMIRPLPHPAPHPAAGDPSTGDPEHAHPPLPSSFCRAVLGALRRRRARRTIV